MLKDLLNFHANSGFIFCKKNWGWSVTASPITGSQISTISSCNYLKFDFVTIEPCQTRRSSTAGWSTSRTAPIWSSPPKSTTSTTWTPWSRRSAAASECFSASPSSALFRNFWGRAGKRVPPDRDQYCKLFFLSSADRLIPLTNVDTNLYNANKTVVNLSSPLRS